MDLQKRKKELNQMKNDLEARYFQVIGQLRLIDDIEKEESKVEEKPNNEVKEGGNG